MSAPNRKGTAGSYTEAFSYFRRWACLPLSWGFVGCAALGFIACRPVGSAVAPGIELAAGLFKGEIPSPVQSTFITGRHRPCAACGGHARHDLYRAFWEEPDAGG